MSRSVIGEELTMLEGTNLSYAFARRSSTVNLDFVNEKGMSGKQATDG